MTAAYKRVCRTDLDVSLFNSQLHRSLSMGVLLAVATSLPPAFGDGIAAAQMGQKRALIVAIGKYPDPSTYGYSNINADNDIPLVKRGLLSQGFSESNTRILANERATKEGIVAALRSMIAETRAGDVLVFHYSGHGHQITDDNGDELDGYDEVLVPYGAPATATRGYGGEKHLRDDTLNDLLGDLRAQAGARGHVLVTIDACFSGSATRAAHELPVRGVLEPIGPPSATRGSSAGVFESATPAVRGAETPDLAPLVVLSATSHNELDHEVRNTDGTPVGPLSLALSRTLPKVRAGMSYGALFEQVRLTMAAMVRAQTPQIEGAANVEVFSGAITEQQHFHRVQEVVGDTIAVISAGSLVGLEPGSRVAFHALDAGPDDPPVMRGIVDFVDEVSAEVRLPAPDRRGAVLASRAFVTEYAYGSLKVNVLLEEPTRTRPLTRGLAALTNVNLVQDSPDLVVAASEDEPGKVYLRTAADNHTVAGPFAANDETGAGALAEQVRGYARNRFLQQVEMRDPAIDVRLEIVPATHRLNRRGQCVTSDTTRYGAQQTLSGWIFKPGDGYLLRLENVGKRAAYVAVLDLTADGAITQLFPDASLGVSDNRLEPGKSYLIEDLCFMADEPFGDEVLKLFATRERVDFGPVLSAKGQTRGGEELSYMEQLLADSFTGTRSGVSGRAQGTGTTHAIAIKVVRGTD